MVNPWYHDLPEPQQQIALQLRELVLGAGPGIEEVMKYGVPFFHYLGHMAYISPIKEYPKAIVLGLTRGAQLSNESGVLEATDRKLIRHIVCRSIEDATRERINPVIQEAVLLNELLAKNKKR